MKILHSEWSDDLGGQEKRVLAEAKGLMDRGCRLAIVCRSHARIKDEALALGMEVYTLPLRRPYDLASMGRLYSFLKKGRFDVVNTHSGIDSWIGGLAAKAAAVPVLVRTRHLNIPLKRSPLNFIHYLPDAYITCGENMRSTLINSCGFPSGKVVSIPTGVADEFFQASANADANRAAYSLPARDPAGTPVITPIITNVGILRGVKGHDVTLRAARIVINSFPKAKVLIVGDGPKRKRLEDLARDLGIEGNVIFTGFVRDVPAVYSFTDISVLSSLSEGVPQSLLQAMASGVPLVATKVGGVPEVVEHEKTGLLVESQDHEALAQAIMRLLQNPPFAARLAEAAKEYVSTHHSLHIMVDRILALYERLLREKKREKTRT